jgi:hypothetical protein
MEQNVLTFAKYIENIDGENKSTYRNLFKVFISRMAIGITAITWDDLPSV